MHCEIAADKIITTIKNEKKKSFLLNSTN